MSLDLDIPILGKVEILSGFSAEQLRLIAFGSQRRELKAGRELFYQGQKAEGGYVVLGGRLDLLVDSQGNLNVVESFGTGSIIGEMSLLVENRRVGTAVAREDSLLLEIPRSVVRRVIEEYPEQAVQLHQKISKSVRQFVSRLEALEKKPSESEV